MRPHSVQDSVELLNDLDARNAIVIGWIHLHPNFSAFLSSIDQHMQTDIQGSLPQAIAIVVDGRSNLSKVFRMTPEGIAFCKSCKKDGFHEHPEGLYEQLDFTYADEGEIECIIKQEPKPQASAASSSGTLPASASPAISAALAVPKPSAAPDVAACSGTGVKCKRPDCMFCWPIDLPSSEPEHCQKTIASAPLDDLPEAIKYYKIGKGQYKVRLDQYDILVTFAVKEYGDRESAAAAASTYYEKLMSFINEKSKTKYCDLRLHFVPCVFLGGDGNNRATRNPRCYPFRPCIYKSHCSLQFAGEPYIYTNRFKAR